MLPPTYAEAVGDMGMRRSTRIKTWFVGTAIVLDICIALALRAEPTVNHRAVRIFALINTPALTFDVLCGELAIRYARTQRTWRIALDMTAFILAATTAIWIQMTGSLTSYFLLCSVGLIITMRLAYGYRTAAIMTACFVVLHTTMVFFERFELLRPESLFTAPPGGVYGAPRLAYIILYSIVFTYAFSFMAVNHAMNRLREKDIALAAAQREAARAGKLGEGRLSGRTLVDRYELGKLLGRGGMGEIYRARRLSDGFDVAIKVLHPHLSAEPAVMERFRREAEAAARVGGVRTARVFETGAAGTHGTEPFIVMEYLRGSDLAQRLRDEPMMALTEALRLVEEMAAALSAAHGAGIVHRDLKPQNVFLTDDDRVVLLDFGVSKMKSGGTTLTADADLLGSPGYMAPEQARGQSEEIGPATDIFALGAIAYRILTGKPAFPSADVVTALFQVCNDNPMPPSAVRAELPRAVDGVLERALAKSPQNRFPHAQEFATALRAALSQPNAAMMHGGGGRSR